MNFPKNSKNKQKAKNLRKNMTREEKHLWYDFLSQYPVRFRRQEIIGNYIADFYCDKARLVIEIDGSQHFEKENERYDLQRTKFFQSLHISVLRFSNDEINTSFEAVCRTIDMAVNGTDISLFADWNRSFKASP